MLRRTYVLYTLIALLLLALAQQSNQPCHLYGTQKECEEQCYPGCQYMQCFIQKNSAAKIYNFSLCFNATNKFEYFKGFCDNQLKNMCQDSVNCVGNFEVAGCKNGATFSESHSFRIYVQKSQINLIMFVLIGMMMLLVWKMGRKYMDDTRSELTSDVISHQSDNLQNLLEHQFNPAQNQN